MSPRADRLLLVAWVTYPPIAQVAEPFLRLAGVRVEPRTRRKHDTDRGYGIAPCARSVTLVDVASGREQPLALPAGGCADAFRWSADGERFVFRNTSYEAVELWVGEAAEGRAHRVGNLRLNPMLGASHQWLADQRTLLVKLVPEQAGPPPTAGAEALGPSVQETDGQSGEASTYELRDTLASARDEALFEYYGTSQLALVDVGTGAVRRLGPPDLYTDLEGAPDGEHLLVTTLRRPYSYVTTYANFAHSVEVWTERGERHVIATLPVAERVPVHGVPTGPRGFSWRATAPATLVWAEALDNGDWNVQVPARDRLLMQSAPFATPPVEVARVAQRAVAVEWSERSDFALLREYDDNRHWMRGLALNLDAPSSAPGVLWDLSEQDAYASPGNPARRVRPDGTSVIRLDGDAMFLVGQGASPEGDRPFLDRFELQTRRARRLFRSERDAFERFLAFTDAHHASFLTWHQSPTSPPNAKLRALGSALPNAAVGEASVASTVVRDVTHLVDPVPQVRSIEKRLVTYQRRDGVPLSFTLYTPPGYRAGTRVPAILYAYPMDYASGATAGQVRGSDQTFTRLRDYQLLLLSGYAIIDAAAFPIVGDPKQAYDTYLEQLVDDARAAVDKAVELGVVDRDRIGVTGHSHGALMTVNLLAHTDLFRAGVATSGSYNKTLTPFGFQNERRSLWKALSVYLKASPFFVADTLRRPLLIMHGADDANPGTTPLQASKLYEAIRGNGGTARLVLLPHEPHWYSALESNEQLAFEELRWFDRHVKEAPPRTASAPAAH